MSSSTVPEPSGPAPVSSSASGLPVEQSETPTPSASSADAYTWTVADQEWLVATGNAVAVSAGLVAMGSGAAMVLLVRRH